MGFHFVNPSLIFDGGVLDPTKPEVLLYAPKPNGERQPSLSTSREASSRP
jgi:hypothetical protein